MQEKQNVSEEKNRAEMSGVFPLPCVTVFYPTSNRVIENFTQGPEV